MICLDSSSITKEIMELLKKPRMSKLTLWSFVFDLLQIDIANEIVVWTKREEFQFKIINKDAIAYLWGNINGRNNMTYRNFSRALRYYYGKEVLEQVIDLCFNNGTLSLYSFYNSIPLPFVLTSSTDVFFLLPASTLYSTICHNGPELRKKWYTYYRI